MTQEIIKLQQEPIIIYSKIQEVGAEVQKRIADLEIEKKAVTEDTVKAVKATRATIRKEMDEFELQRKFIKDKVMQPYNEFEAKYKEFILSHYKSADETLKTKITEFEQKIKDDKEALIKEFFAELCEAEKIDFLPYERLKLNITLTESLDKYKARVEEVITKVANDVDFIKNVPESDDYKSEVLFEYKKNFDASLSFKVVNERREAKEAELKRIEAQKQAKAEAKQRLEQEQKASQQPVQEQPTQPVEAQFTATENNQQPPAELYEMTFKVVGTREQLKALKQFIINNNIQIVE